MRVADDGWISAATRNRIYGLYGTHKYGPYTVPSTDFRSSLRYGLRYGFHPYGCRIIRP
ncbi:hypothetical protein BDQ12DRAFT_687867 [Crucibulum laeve]|uniref:Uncharacterized protein n=1 Tax=Crucibulum laeve TaxID=68775 RepID=A0A5C3LSD8_9AGAR|nr:hypothetical protein BDQ12DRAFT_687867 [Crucibulum laeve]